MSGAVLITGATTPFGRLLSRRLLEDPEVSEVIAVVPPGEIDGLGSEPRLRIAVCDLLRPRSIADLINGLARERSTTTIIHAAFHRASRDGGPRVHRLNVESTRELLRLAESHPTIRRFVLMSHAEIYRARSDEPSIIREDHPLELSPAAPQWIRDRVEADLIACTRMGMVPLGIVVLRCAECLAFGLGSQLFDYLGSRVCFRPMGFDPMMNLLSLPDLVAAGVQAVRGTAQGIFNIPGADTLPLSEAIRRCERIEIPAPGPLLSPLYGLRALVRDTDFRYDLNAWRFHYSGVLDGRRAEAILGYTPQHPLDWPRVAEVALNER